MNEICQGAVLFGDRSGQTVPIETAEVKRTKENIIHSSQMARPPQHSHDIHSRFCFPSTLLNYLKVVRLLFNLLYSGGMVPVMVGI